MKANRKLAITAAIAFVALGGGWLYLHSPAEGRLCLAGQGVKAGADGKLLVCQDGAIWKQPH